MNRLDLSVIDRRRPPAPSAPLDAGPSYNVFGADEVGWLEVEAGSRLGAAGRPLTTLRSHEPTPLARLARDPRLAELARKLGGGERRLVAIELGRAAALRHRRLGDTTLFVELGGDVHGRPGTVHVDVAGMASTTLFLAVGFNCVWAEQDRDARSEPAGEDLWPPATVVAG